MFGVTGWLFADLLLALALAFLLATTIGHKLPKPRPTPTPSPTPTELRAPLELTPVHITFTITDPDGLVAGSPSAIDAVRATILQKTKKINSRSAGIVLLYGSNSFPSYEQLDQSVEKILTGLSSTEPLFQETRYRSFLSLHGLNTFSMDIYLFSRTS